MAFPNIKIAIINKISKNHEKTIDPFLISKFQDELQNYYFKEYNENLEFLNERGGFLLDVCNHSELCLKKCDKYCNLETHVNNVLDFYLKDADIYIYCLYEKIQTLNECFDLPNFIVYNDDFKVFNDVKVSQKYIKNICLQIKEKFNILKKSKKELDDFKNLSNINLKNEIVHILKHYDCVFAGGFILYLLGKTKSFGDIDIFVNSSDTFEKLKKYLEEKYKVKSIKQETYDYNQNFIKDIINIKITIDEEIFDFQIIGISRNFENYINSFDLPFVRLFLKFENNKVYLKCSKYYCPIDEFDEKKFCFTTKSRDRYNKYMKRLN